MSVVVVPSVSTAGPLPLRLDMGLWYRVPESVCTPRSLVGLAMSGLYHSVSVSPM